MGKTKSIDRDNTCYETDWYNWKKTRPDVSLEHAFPSQVSLTPL